MEGDQLAEPRPAPVSETELAQFIERPVFKTGLTSAGITEIVSESAAMGLACVVVPGCEADQALRVVSGTSTVIGCLVGYPWGASATAAKLYEARDLVRRGVREIEFVVNAGKLISRQFQYVESELLQVAQSCHEAGAILKVVLQSRELADDLKVIACKIAKRVEADMILASAETLDATQLLADSTLLRRVSKDLCGVPAAALDLAGVLELHAGGFARARVDRPGLVLEEFRAALARQGSGSSA
jgi:deoxyribose-phosphate aldolase